MNLATDSDIEFELIRFPAEPSRATDERPIDFGDEDVRS
jgi:hypothetical protein